VPPAALQSSLDHVLFVDDESTVRRAFNRLTQSWGFACDTVTDATEALRLLDDAPFGYGVVVVDLHLDGGSGLDLLELVAQRFPWITRVLVSGDLDVDDALEAINRGRVHWALKKPWTAGTLREALRSGQNRAYLAAQRTMGLFEVDRPTEDLGQPVPLRPFLEQLAQRLGGPSCGPCDAAVLSRICRTLGETMGLGASELEALELGALVHDFGKLFLGEPTTETMSLGSEQPERCAALFDGIAGLEDVARLVREQHERFDGLGYPQGLQGSDIGLGARIFRVAEAFLRMVDRDPARIADARESLSLDAGVQFDPDVLQALHAIPDDVWPKTWGEPVIR
jgi:response regulator RpfG family c-di-GMP phosphodiesterase